MSKSLVKNSIFNVIYKIVNVIYPLISVSYVSHMLMATGIGKVSYAQNIVSYFTLIAALGIPTYGIRTIARCKSKEETNIIFSELFIINLISTCICSIIYFSMVFYFKKFQADRILYLVCGLLIPLNIINVDWFYHGKEEYVYIAKRSILMKILSLCALFLLVKTSEDYLKYALINVMALGGNYIFNIINLRKQVKFEINKISIVKHLKPIFILLATVIASELYSKVDITMIEYFYSDLEVGYYSNAIKLINVIITISTAITTVFLPRLSLLYNNDKEQFNKLVSFGMNIITFFVIPCFIGVILVSSDLVPVLFGSSFDGSINVIKILAILVPIKGIGDLLSYQVIISINKEKMFIIFYSIAAIINIILNSIFIPIYSQYGAAVASVISEAIVNIGLIMVAKKYIKISNYSGNLIKIIISTIVMSLYVMIIKNVVFNVYIRLILSVGGAISVYILVNYILKNTIINSTIEKLKKKV